MLSFSEFVEEQGKRIRINEEKNPKDKPPRRDVLKNIERSYDTFQKFRDKFSNEGSAQWHESVSIFYCVDFFLKNEYNIC
jgi:hypothetical protein